MPVTLYLVMRNDLPSLNPGKLAAQAAHVANVAVKKAPRKTLKAWEAWTGEGFGTTIVLSADLKFLKAEMAEEMVFDPTYPCEIPYEVGLHLVNSGLRNIQFGGPKMSRAFYLREEVVGAWAWALDFLRPPPLDKLELYP